MNTKKGIHSGINLSSFEHLFKPLFREFENPVPSEICFDPNRKGVRYGFHNNANQHFPLV